MINWLHSGGLAGEIATHIDRKFQSLKPRLKRQLEPLLRLLVTWNEELTPSSTAIPFKAIEAIGPDATELTNVLLYERCLYLTGDDITEAQVQLTHPGLLQRWAIAKEMLEEVRRDLSSRRLLDAQALHWDSNGRRPEDQWLENELTLTAQTLLQKESDSLPRLTREFLTTFQQAEEQSSTTPLRKIKQLVKPLSIVILSFALVREFVTPSPPQEATPHATSPIKASSLGEAPAPPPAPSKITLSQDTYHPTPEAEAFNPLAH